MKMVADLAIVGEPCGVMDEKVLSFLEKYRAYKLAGMIDVTTVNENRLV
jgi:hypothetical protein